MQEENKKKDFFTSFLATETEIYEMYFDKLKNESRFVKFTKEGKMEMDLSQFEHNGITYKPYEPENNLISRNVILFPSYVGHYENVETLLSDMQKFIHKYVDISPFYEAIATHYVLFSWMYDRFNEVPYLRALGDYGSGKSRFLQTIGSLCYKPMFMGGSTTASPIFRIIDAFKGTLILDEADLKHSEMTNDTIKILNQGYQKGMSVLRSESKGKTNQYDVKAYDVYCPKIIASREKFNDKALESRFLIEEMGTSLRKDIPRTLSEEFFQEAELLRNQLLAWRLHNYFKSIKLQDEVIENIHPRLGQILIPLLSISEDKTFKENLKKFVVEYNNELIEDRGLSTDSDIVFAILKLEHQNQSKKLTVKQISEEVNYSYDISEDRLTPKKVGWFLRSRLHLKPIKTRDGYVLTLAKDRKKLDMWKERFGIKDSEIRGEIVNETNLQEEEIINPNQQIF